MAPGSPKAGFSSHPSSPPMGEEKGEGGGSFIQPDYLQPVIDLQGQGIDGRGINPAAFLAPAVDGFPTAVRATVLFGALVLEERVFYLFVPGLPARTIGSVILVHTIGAIEPIIVVNDA